MNFAFVLVLQNTQPDFCQIIKMADCTKLHGTWHETGLYYWGTEIRNVFIRSSHDLRKMNPKRRNHIRLPVCAWNRNAVLQSPYAASEAMQLRKVSGKKKCSYHPSSSTCAGRRCDKLKTSEKKTNVPETQVFTCRSGYQHTPPFHSLFQHQCFPHQWRQNDKWLSLQVEQVNNDILMKLFEVPV